MNKRSLVGLASIRLDSGDSECVLGAASNHDLNRFKPGSTDEIGDQADLTNLTRHAKHRSELAPGLCVSETIHEIGEAVDFEVRKRVCRYVALHCNSRRTKQDKEATDQQ